MKNEVNVFLSQKKMISPPFELCIGKYPGVCTISIKASKCYLMFMVFHAVI